MGTIVLHGVLAVLMLHFHISWLSHLATTTCSVRSVCKSLCSYQVLIVFNATCQSVSRFLLPWAIGFSFIVSSICNVIALSMFHRMDKLIYTVFVSCGLVVFVIAVTVMQFAAESVEGSANCIKKFKNAIKGRKKKWLRGKLMSLRLIGFEMGAFYLISKDMVIIYCYHMLAATMNALLLN